jgi:cytochrome b561
LPKSLPAGERYAAKLTHIALYLVLLAMPPSGVYLSQSAGFDVSPYGLVTLPTFFSPDLSIPVPQRPGVILGTLLHKTWLAYALYAFLALHLAGVFKHLVIDRDRALFARMGGRPRQSTDEQKD